MRLDWRMVPSSAVVKEGILSPDASTVRYFSVKFLQSQDDLYQVATCKKSLAASLHSLTFEHYPTHLKTMRTIVLRFYMFMNVL